MPHQTTIFDDPRRLARRTDPRSSRKAAEEIVRSGKRRTQKQRVLEALERHPNTTSAELAQIMGVDRWLVARRLPDLARDGKVKRGRFRDCKVNGTLAHTWRPI